MGDSFVEPIGLIAVNGGLHVCLRVCGRLTPWHINRCDIVCLLLSAAERQRQRSHCQEQEYWQRGPCCDSGNGVTDRG